MSWYHGMPTVTHSTPNFMAALCLSIKRKTKLLSHLDNISICYSRELFTRTFTGTINSTLNVSNALVTSALSGVSGHNRKSQ
jgi:hypothetical protein